MTQAVREVAFSIDAGECLGLVGRSGCGKSTVARLVSRMLEPDGGQIILAGQDIAHAKGRDLAEVYDILQMVFQQPEESFDPRRTIGWSVGEPLRHHGVEAGEARSKAGELLADVGLSEVFIDRYPHEISGGECQRAALARALALQPRLLICDEITSALDVTVQQEILALLQELIRKQKLACLFITHDLNLLSGFAKRTAVMSNGRLVEMADTESLLLEPQSEAARQLLASDLFFDF